MTNYIAGRLLQAVVVVWFVASIVFIVVRLTPGDAARQLAGPDATQETVDDLNRQLGLDRPLPEQYVSFLTDALQGDLSRSLRLNEPALDVVMDRAPATLRLAAVGMLISVGLGGLIGVLSATRPRGFVDRFGKLFAILGQSMPTFWIGLLGILFFSVQLGWLPTSGTGSWKHYILPAATLGWFSMAAMVRLTRSAMLDVLESDYVRLLRIKGLSRRSIIYKHALRNAAIPVLTLASLQLIGFLSGSVVVETIFAWPGVGRLMIDSINNRDYTIVQAVTLLISVSLVLINLLVDISYAFLDPRIKYGGAAAT